MTIDVLASEPQYAAHIAPVWDALTPALRGSVLEGRRPPRTSDAVLVASGRDLLKAKHLGFPRIALLEHGIGQSYSNRHPAHPGGINRGAASLFLSPNETAGDRDQAAYPKAHVAVIGSPHLDALPALEANTGTVAISFHWRGAVAPETRSAFDHFRSAIHELADAVPLIGHGHPRIQRELEPFYRSIGVEFVADFDEVCRRASLYVCDNSSTLFEFASTGRPVLVMNAPAYRRSVHHGLRFWEAADVGLQVDDPSQLEAAVRYALLDRQEQATNREAALRLVYAYRSGAAARAATALEEWAA